MVKVRIIGGLGNQMFQYATAKSLATKRNTDVSADVSAFNSYELHGLGLDKFNCICQFDTANSFFFRFILLSNINKFFKNLIFNIFNVFKEVDLKYDPSINECNSKVYLLGYFQSEKYFYDIRDLLIKEFSLRNPLTTYELKNESLIVNNESVAIHIRRGDYISNEDSNSIHGICDNSYFYESLNYLKKNNIISEKTKLFVFSDDIQWCKDNLKFDFSTVFIEGDSKRPEVDMHLMSKCDHNIISNSTFSWWAAWLNTNPDKCIIAPKQWFKTIHDSTDIVPKQWIRI